MEIRCKTFRLLLLLLLLYRVFIFIFKGDQKLPLTNANQDRCTYAYINIMRVSEYNCSTVMSQHHI